MFRPARFSPEAGASAAGVKRLAPDFAPGFRRTRAEMGLDPLGFVKHFACEMLQSRNTGHLDKLGGWPGPQGMGVKEGERAKASPGQESALISLTRKGALRPFHPAESWRGAENPPRSGYPPACARPAPAGSRTCDRTAAGRLRATAYPASRIPLRSA